MELKQGQAWDIPIHLQAFNRTTMELKRQKIQHSGLDTATFNRTTMELKHFEKMEWV